MGYDLSYNHAGFTPVIFMLAVHPSRQCDLRGLDVL